MITTNQILTLVGKTGIFHVKTLKFNVKILNARSVFGREDVLIEPIAGSGQSWVSSDSVQLMEKVV